MNEWRMHAGVDVCNGGFMYFGDQRYVEAYGREPVEVIVTEDPEGPYWGWVYDPEGRYSTNGVPTFIQQFEPLYNMQFTYGPEAEEKAGKGKTVRLRVERA